MLLKEIEMDLPYQRDDLRIENIRRTGGLEYNKAVKKDYELNWKEKRRDFQLMTRCMTSMVSRLLPKIKTEDCWKIIIECSEKVCREGYVNLSGVCIIQVQFDYSHFCQLKDNGKKIYVIDKIIEGIDKLDKLMEFDIKEIKAVCFKIKESKYINEWLWKKPVKHKDKFVQIKISHDVDNVTLYMCFFNKNMELLEEILLLSTVPDEWAYASYLGNLKWVSDNSAVLITKKGESIVGCLKRTF